MREAKALVPKLRLAEFRHEPPWEPVLLGKLAKRINQRNTHGADLRVLTNSAEHGVLDQREYFDKDIATNTGNYFIVELGDYVYNPRKSAAAPVGPISKNQIGTGVMSPLYSVFRFLSDANDFFAHYFKSSHWHGYLRRVSNKGARHDRMAITNDDLMRMPIPTPSPSEQQKIADCLDSLDDLIAAEGRKLEALRQHKQGLMQQLFPQPGETVPKLQFTEFLDSGEWETIKLGDFASRGKEAFDPRKSSDTPRLIELENIESRTGRILGAAELKKQTSLKSRFESGDVLFGKLRPYLQKFARPDFNGVCTTEIWVLRSKIGSNAFLFYLVQTERFIQLANISSGSRMPRAEWNFLADSDFKIPQSDEQRKIANCLDTLDDQITAEGRKLQALRQHKQALMQQLFPSIDGQ